MEKADVFQTACEVRNSFLLKINGHVYMENADTFPAENTVTKQGSARTQTSTDCEAPQTGKHGFTLLRNGSAEPSTPLTVLVPPVPVGSPNHLHALEDSFQDDPWEVLPRCQAHSAMTAGGHAEAQALLFCNILSI